MSATKQTNLKRRLGFSFYWKVLKNAFSNFFSEDTLTQSAALAYYMVFALPSILVIIFWLAGLWYKGILITKTVLNEFSELMGEEGARQLINTLEKITSTKPSIWAAVIGIGALLFMASTVFVTMKRVLNKIFGQTSLKKKPKRGIWKVLFDRFVSITMIAIVALIITLSITLGALITDFSTVMETWLGISMNWLLFIGLIALNIAIHALLFAIAYRYLPDHKLRWGDIWFGASFTGVLFIAGKTLIAFFIRIAPISNFYDAAGSILMLMLWVYFSSAIFYFGAFVTQSRAELINQNNEIPENS